MIVFVFSAKEDDIKSKLNNLIALHHHSDPSGSFFRQSSTCASTSAADSQVQQQQEENCSASAISGFTINEVIKTSSSSQNHSVVRLAGSSLKNNMEYPHHSDADSGPTVVMSTSSVHHENVPMHSQHVEVIKTAGHVAPLHSNSNEHHHHMNSKDDVQNVEVLQVQYPSIFHLIFFFIKFYLV